MSVVNSFKLQQIFDSVKNNQNDYNCPVILAQDILYEKCNKIVKRYLLFNYNKKFICSILTKDKHYYEVLTGFHPIAFTADIDDKNNNPVNETITNIQNFLTHIFTKYIEDNPETEITTDDIQTLITPTILESKNNDTNAIKNSFHLVFRNIIFEHQWQFQEFTRYLLSQKIPDNLVGILNDDLIKKNNCVRCVNQSKYGKDNNLIPVGDKDLEQYLTQVYDTTNTKFIQLDWDYIKEQSSIKNSRLNLPKTTKTKLSKNHDNNTFMKQILTITIPDWIESLTQEDLSSIKPIFNKHYVDFLVSLLPNPDNDRKMPWSVWSIVCQCLAGIQKRESHSFIEAFKQLSERPLTYYYKQQYNTTVINDERLQTFKTILLNESISKYNQQVANDTNNNFNLWFLENVIVKVLRPDIKKKNFRQMYNSLTYDMMRQEMQSPDVVYREKYMRDINIDKADVLLFGVNMGCGKTTALAKFTTEQIIDYYKIYGEFPYVYLITNRVALADKFKNDFIGFTHYQDNVRDITDHKNVIIQLDSIVKCINLDKVKQREHNIIVLDEFESILSHFNSDTLNGKLYEVAKTFFTLMEQCRKILIADAFLSQRTLDIVKHVCGDRKIIFEKNEQHNIKRDLFVQRHNRQIFDPRTQTSMTGKCEDDYVAHIINLLKNGKRVVCPCASKQVLQNKLIPSLKENNIENFKVYYSGCDMSDAEIKAGFMNPNEEWKNLQCVAYSPVITIGTSFDIPNVFDQCVIYGKASNSCCARDLIQAHYRVRHLKDNKVHLYINNTPDYRDQPIIYKDFETFAKYNNLNINAGDKLTSIVHRIMAWNKYEEQMSEWNYYDTLIQYFQDCNYTIHKNYTEDKKLVFDENVIEEEVDKSSIDYWVEYYLQKYFNYGSKKTFDELQKCEAIECDSEYSIKNRQASLIEKQCHSVLTPLQCNKKYLNLEGDVKQTLTDFAYSYHTKDGQIQINNYKKLFSNVDEEIKNTSEVDINHLNNLRRTQYIKMIAEQCNYFKDNINTEHLKKIFEKTTQTHYTIFKYRNRQQADKYTNNFHKFVQHCLKQYFAMNDRYAIFNEIEGKQIMKKGVRYYYQEFEFMHENEKDHPFPFTELFKDADQLKTLTKSRT